MDIAGISSGIEQAQRSARIARGADGQKEKLKEACEDFEALFVKQMYKAMDKTVERKGLLSGGMAENYFRDMLIDSYADNTADSVNLGIAEMMYRQMEKQITV